MSKKLLITEKPSVAMQFSKALKLNATRKDGYLESEEWIITWCVGHLVTMSYPEKYDEKLKLWRQTHFCIISVCFFPSNSQFPQFNNCP